MDHACLLSHRLILPLSQSVGRLPKHVCWRVVQQTQNRQSHVTSPLSNFFGRCRSLFLLLFFPPHRIAGPGPGPGPWTWTLDPDTGPRHWTQTLDPDIGPGILDLDLEVPTKEVS